MSRGLSSTYVTSSMPVVYPGLFAAMDFSSSILRIWTGNTTKNISDDFGGGDYLGISAFGGISSLTETAEVAAKGIELTLNSIPSEYLSLAFNSPYRGRKVYIYLLLFDSTYSTYEKITVFSGFMDQMNIDDGPETGIIKLKCESRLIKLNVAQDIRYTDEAQKALHPADKGLEFVSSMADKSIYWGNETPVSNVSNGSVGSNSGDGGQYAKYMH